MRYLFIAHSCFLDVFSDGTGILVVKFISILKDIERLCENNHVFWLLENTGSMFLEYKETICSLLGVGDSHYIAGASCSKLTISLINDSLKFQMAILQIHCYFLVKKCENPLHCKGFSHFINKK